MLPEILAALALRVPLAALELAADADSEFITAHCCTVLTPAPPEPAEDWLRRKLTLSRGQSSEYEGEPVDFRRVPHARVILDFLLDPYAEELNIMKSSAAALTTSTIALCVWTLATDPCNIMYILGSKEEAAKMSKQVWQPFLRQAFGVEEVDSEEQGNLSLKINGCELHSGSPTANLMRGKQVRIFIEDESDNMKDTLHGGGESLEGAERARTKNTRSRKVIRLCAPIYAYDPKRPKVEQPRTRIHRNYLRGNMMEWRCTCPGCGIENPMVPEDLHYEHAKLLDGTWDLDAIELDTVWQCPSCRYTVHEGSEKAAIVEQGRAVATNPKPESRRVWSFKHTDMISIIGNATWGVIAKELERTRGTLEYADVRRNHLAEPEDISSKAIGRDSSTILRHCGSHERGTCPILPWHVGLISDMQKDKEREEKFGGTHFRFPWMQGALDNRTGDIYVIDWGETADFDALFLAGTDGRIHGLYGQPIPLALSSATLATRFPNGNAPRQVFTSRAILDSGYRARNSKADESDASSESAYGFCMRTYSPRENRFLFCPVKGRAGVQIQGLLVDSSVDVRGIALPLLLFDDWAFKRDLYNIRLASDPINPTALARQRGRIILPRADDIDTKLIEHLCSERLVEKEEKTATGKMVTRSLWETSGPNDFGDDLKLFLVLFEALRTTLLRQQGQAMATAAA